MKALKLKAQRVRSAPFCGGSIKAVAVFVAALLVPVSASLLAQSPSPAAQSQSEAVDVTALKAQLAEQQKQIDQLKSALQEQMKMLERVSNGAPAPENRQLALPPNKAPLGEVASTTPYIPAAAAIPTAVAAPVAATAAAPVAAASAVNAAQTPADQTPTSPLQIKVGDAYIIPIGFMDFTSEWRATTAVAASEPISRASPMATSSRITFPSGVRACRTPASASAWTRL